MDVDLDPYENDIYQSDVELEHVDDQANTIEKYKKDKLEETLRGKYFQKIFLSSYNNTLFKIRIQKLRSFKFRILNLLPYTV